ncbi:MAG: ribosome-associated translation inhibitor RaiA [Candidatus Eisenbacteria bacterium]|uniref:Ribosome-associated translation inhibitor RaiA n=1 Tax=Eiseniibacteriota bacterium TaxID=2212470 RepID=A0A849SK23_UNCEI|nr:ribosome-associated translation inhibitor RaiA [Candidatus Eisenbacteria bacterium]
MHVTTTARHFTLESPERSHAQERLDRLTKFLVWGRNRVQSDELHLIVTAEKHGYTAEVTLRVGRRELVSREQADEARVAIDLAASKLEERLRRLKDRAVDHRRTEHVRIADEPSDGARPDAEEPFDWLDGQPAED